MSLPKAAKVTMDFQVPVSDVDHSLSDSSPLLSPEKKQFSFMFYIPKHHILLKWHFD